MFYQAKLKAMPPKLLADDKKNIIRPRPIAESDLQALQNSSSFRLFLQSLWLSGWAQRQVIKTMLMEWETISRSNRFYTMP